MKNKSVRKYFTNKIRLFCLCLILIPATVASAQDTTSVSTQPDTIKAVFDIFDRLNTVESNGSTVKLDYAPEIKSAIQQHFDKGSTTKLRGWRVRIFRDNSQDARQRSEDVAGAFKSNYGIPVYRSYQAPYFYVSVGDFRTRDEAEKLKKELRSVYPGASLIQAQINLPPL